MDGETNEEILKELRTIRTLLAIDKRERLEELTTDLPEVQVEILSRLDYSEWRSLPTDEIAEEVDSSTTTVRNHRTELEDNHLLMKRGQGRGAKYRKTGLINAAEIIGLIDEPEN